MLHLGNTISNSWASLEGLGNPAQFIRVNRILQMAAAQGVDVNFASGDFGDDSPLVGFKTVEFPGSSPFATSIGGTSLFMNASRQVLFETGWGTNLARIANRASQGSTPVDPPPTTRRWGSGSSSARSAGRASPSPSRTSSPRCRERSGRCPTSGCSPTHTPARSSSRRS